MKLFRNAFFSILRNIYPWLKNSPSKRPRGRPKKEIKEEDDDEDEDDLKNSTINAQIPFFEKIRGLKKKIGDRYWYTSHKMMLEYQIRFKNTFTVNMCPPDFTTEDFASFVFPKPIEELIVFPEKLSKIAPKSGTECDVCNERVSTPTALREHFIQFHTVHYLCPYEKCGYVFSKSNNDQNDLAKLARHIFYHDRKPLQYNYPHECLACGYKTPYTCYIADHLKHQGPFHDNKCPNCEDRFYSRASLLQHFKEFQHEGYTCGICQEVRTKINM